MSEEAERRLVTYHLLVIDLGHELDLFDDEGQARVVLEHVRMEALDGDLSSFRAKDCRVESCGGYRSGQLERTC